jgi:dTDP-4-dehydrorhamnose 3,5-epimerase
MKVTQSALLGVRVVELRVFRDERGYFLETWSEERYAAAGIDARFVQDNLSYSRGGVLRGLHFQEPHAQGKLVSVLRGEVFDVAVDVRVGSPTFGRWEGFTLSAENGRQLYLPPGFAHGFVVTSEDALFAYKCTDYYHPGAERTLLWSDPELGIEWPVESPLVSPKDRGGLPLREVPPEHLPRFE